MTLHRAVPAALALLLLAGCQTRHANAPRMEQGSVRFALEAPEADSVFLAGDFNGWDPDAAPMTREEGGLWTARANLSVGYHEYRFVVDGDWQADPANPATVLNNHGEPNSVVYVAPEGRVVLRGYREGEEKGVLEAGEGTVHLALIWHQHQPYYLDAAEDQLIAPWVRTHTTKDYYDMTAMLREQPEVHVSMNLTPVLLRQLDRYYVQRLGPYYDAATNSMDEDAFLQRWEGHTDPWIDLMLQETASFTPEQRDLLHGPRWSCFSISHVIMERWPRYVQIKQAFDSLGPDGLTLQDLRDLKCLFYLANFDPSFLEGEVELVTGRTVDLSDLVEVKPGPHYHLAKVLTERDANRIVAEFYKIAEAVIPLHREMLLDPASGQGQVEVTTTPYYHPILPLIMDVHAGRSAEDQPPDSLHFRRPQDARAHVEMAWRAHHDWFGVHPAGMWPAEGSVSPAVLDLFAETGVAWIATGDGVLAKSSPVGMEATTPYVATGPKGGRVAMFFRDTHLSDLVGFRYSRWDPEEAATDLIHRILAKAPEQEGDSRLLTILLDGENAWEWYERDPDARRFLSLLYEKLAEQQEAGRIITVTPAEYLRGNPARGIEPHPLEELPAIEELWPGSWIHASFATWIGEDEENRAWAWLAKVRGELAPYLGQEYRPLPGYEADRSPHRLLLEDAWHSMLAAEGSDWFWWYGDDQNTGEGDQRWDRLYRKHLRMVYDPLIRTGYELQVPDIPNLMDPAGGAASGGGTMSEGE